MLQRLVNEMPSTDREARPNAHDCRNLLRARRTRSLLLVIGLALVFAFAASTGAAAAASSPKPHRGHHHAHVTTPPSSGVPGYDQATIDKAIAALAKLEAALQHQLHGGRAHSHRHT